MSRTAPGVLAPRSTRSPGGNSWSVLWLLVTIALGMGVPLAAFWIGHRHGWEITPALTPLILAAAVVDLALTVWSGIAGLRAGRLPDIPADGFSTMTAIVRAGPDASPVDAREAVAELTAGRYFKPARVVLAYTYPSQAEAVQDWESFAVGSPSVELFSISAGSKDGRLQSMLDMTIGDVVATFDAGPESVSGCIGRAWLWIPRHYDVASGRQATSTDDFSLSARLFAVDLQAAAASPLPIIAPWDDIQLWCEDGNFTCTAPAGQVSDDGHLPPASTYSLVHDRHGVSWRPGPATVADLWIFHQEDGFDHLRIPAIAIWSCLRAEQSSGSRATLFDRLVWKPVYVWLSPQAVTIAGFEWWRHGGTDTGAWLPAIALLLVLTLVPAALIRTLFAYLVAGKRHRLPRTWYAGYMFASLAFYGALKAASLRVAQLRLIAGRRATLAPPTNRDSDRQEPEREPTATLRVSSEVSGEPLAEQAAALRLRIDAQEIELSALRSRLDELERYQRRQEEWQRLLAHLTDGTVSGTDTTATIELLSHLHARPSHLVVLASLSQHAATLDDIVQTYAQIRAALTTGAAGESAPANRH